MRWDTREPCESCPYRKDAKPGFWDPSHFKELLANDRDPVRGAIYGCHGTRKHDQPSICAGWLLDQKRRDAPCLGLRVALVASPHAQECYEQVRAPHGVALYESIEAMCLVNLRAKPPARRLRPRAQQRRPSRP